MQPTNLLFIVSFSLLLAGCGAGGGGGDAAAPPAGDTDTTTPTIRDLGSRSVPGGQVTVTALTALVPGQPATFRITTVGMTGVAAVSAHLGTGFADAQPLTVTADDAGWLATATLPDPLPATSRVLVSLTDADGAVQETGVDDFAIAAK